MFLPTTRKEMQILGWDELDVILVNGDAYIDSPYIGVSIIGHLLVDAGFRVGVIGQPDISSDKDIGRLGEPRLFWGVSGGGVDSMVANYTALKKRRRKDDYTPGGVNDQRPDRAVIVYTNLVRRYFSQTAPIVLGGVEASLRRISHYDFWSNKVRRSVLFDAKADILVYGMGENATLELTRTLAAGGDPTTISGLCHIAKQPPLECLQLPSHEDCASDHTAFTEMFRTFYNNNEPISARPLCQQHGDRWLVQNRPADFLTQAELDHVHELPFERSLHPFHGKNSEVRALDTIRFSLPALRGCYGECNFCSIAVHQGQTVRWRSEESLIKETGEIAALADFKGNIMDVGGPTANMYGFECAKKLAKGPCLDKRCVDPTVCPTLKPDHSRQIRLLEKMRKVKGVKKVFVASGIRHDMVLADRKNGGRYLKQLAGHHVSGQLKLAPEHSVDHVLKRMGKPGVGSLVEFRRRFLEASRVAGRKQFLTYYMIAAHPGCRENDMRQAKDFVSERLKLNPEQVQIFTPLPSSWSAVMYLTGKDPFTGEEIFVERDPGRKQAQKDILVEKGLINQERIRKGSREGKRRISPRAKAAAPTRSGTTGRRNRRRK
ncbi:MAG: YgiQ family radical SAM protein [Gemmatimonadales bacterium]|nr:YgiQ family radical SAM protein [Gemmatimonadales bacterium]